MTAGPDNVTVTPGRTAFVVSVTVPLMAPVVVLTVCAYVALDATSRGTVSAATSFASFISSSQSRSAPANYLCASPAVVCLLSGSASATNSAGWSLAPMGTTMYCRPLCMYVMGAPVVPDGSSVSHTT